MWKESYREMYYEIDSIHEDNEIIKSMDSTSEVL